MQNIFYGNPEDNANKENPSYSGLKEEKKLSSTMTESIGGTYGE